MVLDDLGKGQVTHVRRHVPIGQERHDQAVEALNQPKLEASADLVASLPRDRSLQRVKPCAALPRWATGMPLPE